MRILYGIQGTGNGHLSRSMVVAEALGKYADVETEFLVSGRPRTDLFDMEVFGDYQWRQGLSFATRAGKVSYLDTVSKNPWRRFWQDVHSLDLSMYDLVVSDFEPVTAWAARLQKVRSVGIGRQYAFFDKSAELPINGFQRAMLKQFAPCDTALGMHWNRMSKTTLPPVIKRFAEPAIGHSRNKSSIVVYLPFESVDDIEQLLRPLTAYHFAVFHPRARRSSYPHICYHTPSRAAFARAFESASGVISNAGFETSSEALAHGKKLLVRPLRGQFEQYANAYALAEHDLASVMFTLDSELTREWLNYAEPVTLNWPDVASEVASWIRLGCIEPIELLSARLWQSREGNRQAVA